MTTHPRKARSAFALRAFPFGERDQATVAIDRPMREGDERSAADDDESEASRIRPSG